MTDVEDELWKTYTAAFYQAMWIDCAEMIQIRTMELVKYPSLILDIAWNKIDYAST